MKAKPAEEELREIPVVAPIEEVAGDRAVEPSYEGMRLSSWKSLATLLQKIARFQLKTINSSTVLGSYIYG